MLWYKQAEMMMETWLDTQKSFWDSWSQAVTPSSIPALPSADFINQWQQMVLRGFDQLGVGSAPASRQLSRQMISAQAMTMRYLEFSAQTWQAILPKMQAGQDWQALLRASIDQFRNQFAPRPSAPLQMTRDMNELWQLYLQEIQELVRPWADSMQASPGHFADALGPSSGSQLVKLSSLYWDAYERTLGRMADMPRMGFTREFDERLLKGFDSWTELRRASIDYQLVLGDAWARIYEQVTLELLNRVGTGKPVQSLRELMRMWTEIADRELETVFSSGPYTEAQKMLFNSAMRYRNSEQEVVETFLKTSYVPSRSELDEVHKAIYELRKEVKALKKALRDRA